MTLYYSDPDDGRGEADEGTEQIIDNHAEYVTLTDDGVLKMDLGEMAPRKRKSLLDAAVDAVRNGDTYTVVVDEEPAPEDDSDQ